MRDGFHVLVLCSVCSDLRASFFLFVYCLVLLARVKPLSIVMYVICCCNE